MLLKTLRQPAVSSLFSVLMMAFENRSGMMVLNSEAQLYQLDIAMGKSTFNAKKTAAARGLACPKLFFCENLSLGVNK